MSKRQTLKFKVTILNNDEALKTKSGGRFRVVWVLQYCLQSLIQQKKVK
jgi:hypothetical protein